MKIADKFVVPMEYTHFGYEFLQDMGDGLHLGVDLNYGTPWQDEGKQISATASGLVVYSKTSKGKRGWGNLVILEHVLASGEKIYSRYGHLKERWIAEGQEIDCGAGIGTCGSTGKSSAPHLHWDMFIEKFLKDGNKITAYPQKWNARKLRAYFFDPLKFVKNFIAEIEEEDIKKELEKHKRELGSIKEGLQKIATDLANLPGEHKVEPTIDSIRGEIGGWIDLEDKYSKCTEKLNVLVRQNKQRWENWSKVVGMSIKDENEALKAFKGLVRFKKDHEKDYQVWKRKLEELKKGGGESWPRLIIPAIRKFCGDLRESLLSRFSER